jgi:hypothetical protein
MQKHFLLALSDAVIRLYGQLFETYVNTLPTEAAGQNTVCWQFGVK